MSASPHELWLASAGTGKTYRLTGHYLRRLLLGDEPARILATTFTRKAAGEILERVLGRLLESARGGKALVELRELVPERPPGAADCAALLLRVLRELDRFRILTLDAFYLQLAQSMSLELDLPLGWRIADEVEERELQAEAVRRFIAGFEREERHESLVQLLRELQHEGASRRVFDAIVGVIDDGRAPFLECTAEAWDRPEVDAGAAKDDARRADELLGQLGALPLARTAKGEERKSWQKHVARLQQAVSGGDWKDVLALDMVGRCHDDEPKFDRVAIGPDWLEVLRPLHAIAGRALLLEVRRRNEATRELLTRYEHDYREVKRERGVARFEDLPPLLLSGADRDDAELDIDYLIDGRLDHVLLDEFQDTAPTQWRVLERLCEEVLSDGTGDRSFFCVGDVKQSIYGWRSAEPRLLAGMEARYGDFLTTRTMIASYRSSPVVLDAVHRVFNGLDESPVLDADGRDPFRRAAATFLSGYERHVPAKPCEELAGSARVVEARPRMDEDEGEEDAHAPVIERAVERVRFHRRSRPGDSIAVLLRTNRLIGRIQSALAEFGVPASGEGGNPLTDAAAVLEAISLLQLADHPGDKAADFHLRRSPFWAAAGLGPEDERRSASRHLRRRLWGEGLGPFFAALLPVVERDPRYGAWDARRFGQMVDLAYAFDARATPRLDRFTDFLRENRVEDPASAGVQVMTIHASKGLDFDVVVLPQLDESLSPRAGKVLYHRPDPRGPITAATTHPGKDILALDPDLKLLHDTHLERSFGESLCLLYVAMTRAKRHLELILQAKQKESSALTFATLVRAALDLEPADDSAGVLWTHPESSDEAEPPPEEAVVPEVAARSLRFAAPARPRRLERHAPTERPSSEGAGKLWGRELFAGDSAARRLGTLVHRFFEEVEWVEDFDAADDVLLELATALEPDDGLRKAALERFRGALDDPTVRARLSRAGNADGLFSTVEVLREHPFALVLEGEDGESRLWRGTIDRLVLEREGDAVSRAEVIDFKTGPPDRDAEKRHAAQLEAYREAVVASFGVDAERVACTILQVP